MTKQIKVWRRCYENQQQSAYDTIYESEYAIVFRPFFTPLEFSINAVVDRPLRTQVWLRAYAELGAA